MNYKSIHSFTYHLTQSNQSGIGYNLAVAYVGHRTHTDERLGCFDN